MMSGLNLIEPAAAAASLVAALLNSLWQGLLVFVPAWIFLRTLRFLNATTRYVVWCAALLFVVALPFSSGWHTSGERLGPEQCTPLMEETTEGIPLTSLSAPDLVVLERPRDVPDAKAESSASPRELVAKPVLVEDYGVFSIGSTRAPQWNLPIKLAPGRWTVLVALGWIVVASLMLGRVLWSYLYLHRLKRTSLPVIGRFQSRLEEWRKVSGSRRGVQLRCSNRITGPVAAGLTRPVILLPCCLVEKLSAEELDQVGLHEMAHLARWDDWTNLVQKLLEAVFFFHPAIHWIGRQLDAEREIACDDWVIFRTGKPKPYAACLTRLVELTGRGDVPALAPGSWTTKKQISRRIEMSLNRSRNYTPRLSKASLFVSVVVLLFVGIQFARTSPLVRAVDQEVKKQEKVSPTKEKAQQEEEEALSEEPEEPEEIPVERPLKPEQRLLLEMAEEKEKQQQYQEFLERQQHERQALLAEEERRARALRALKERQIEQEHRRAAALKEFQIAQEHRRAEEEALLHELNQEAFERGVVQYATPLLATVDEEPAIPEDELIALMSEIVRNDSDSKVRAAALESIGRLGSEAASESLADLYDSIPELELKKKALSSMSYSRTFTPKVRAKLIDIAKTSPHEELRKAALRALAGVPEDEGANALISIYDSVAQTEIKKTVIRYLSYNRSEAAINRLKAIAREDSDAALRLEAVQCLGQLYGRGLFVTPREELLFVDERPMLAVPVPEPPVPPKPPKKK